MLAQYGAGSAKISPWRFCQNKTVAVDYRCISTAIAYLRTIVIAIFFKKCDVKR